MKTGKERCEAKAINWDKRQEAPTFKETDTGNDSRRHTVRPPKKHSKDLHVRIEKRAYELYERRMRKGALDDWLEAEREILSPEPSS